MGRSACEPESWFCARCVKKFTINCIILIERKMPQHYYYLFMLIIIAMGGLNSSFMLIDNMNWVRHTADLLFLSQDTRIHMFYIKIFLFILFAVLTTVTTCAMGTLSPLACKRSRMQSTWCACPRQDLTQKTTLASWKCHRMFIVFSQPFPALPDIRKK